MSLLVGRTVAPTVPAHGENAWIFREAEAPSRFGPEPSPGESDQGPWASRRAFRLALTDADGPPSADGGASWEGPASERGADADMYGKIVPKDGGAGIGDSSPSRRKMAR